jgi:hypothetical protein
VLVMPGLLHSRVLVTRVESVHIGSEQDLGHTQGIADGLRDLQFEKECWNSTSKC